jgi:hypothetical protein
VGTGGGSAGGAGGAGGQAGAGAGGAGGQAGAGGAGPNLITNGDFSSGAAYWNVTEDPNATFNVVNGVLCANVGLDEVAIVGWTGPSTVPLAAGVPYRFSFKASSSAALYMFTAKVGQTVQPYLTDVEQAEQLGSTLTAYSLTFTLTASDPSAGLAFGIYYPSDDTTVCLDDVSLVQGN